MKDEQGRDLLASEQAPLCVHCSLAEAVNEWRLGQGAKDWLATERDGPALDISDTLLMRAAVMSGLASIMMDMLHETSDADDKLWLATVFNGEAERIGLARTMGGRAPHGGL